MKYNGKESIATVGQLRKLLESYADDAPILAQVIGGDSGVWNVFLSGAHGKDCGFKWEPYNPVILQMWHPDVKQLNATNLETTISEVRS